MAFEVLSEGGVRVILAVIIGALAAIIYSLRILVLLERRMARVDENLQRITLRIASEEVKILREEKRIEDQETKLAREEGRIEREETAIVRKLSKNKKKKR